VNKIFLIMFVLVLFFSTNICFAASSVMILANKASTPGAMGVRSAAVKSAVSRVASFFVDKGIGVFDEQAMEDIYGEIEQSGKIDIDMDDNLLIALALKHKAEVLVKMEVFSMPGSPGDETASVRVIAKMFNVATGRLFAMSEQYDSNIIPNRNARAASLVAASSKAGYRVGKRLYNKLETKHPRILARLVRSDVPEYRLVFLGFTEDENDIIIEFVYDGIGLNEKDVDEKKVTPGFAELEILTDKNFKRLCRKLKRGLKRQDIFVEKTSVMYDKATFYKEGAESDIGKIRIE
jgi:hypothetical protein